MFGYKISFMITVISGTNRPNSNTLTIAKWCFEKIAEDGIPCKLLDLCNLDFSSFSNEMYEKGGQNPHISQIQQEFLISSKHWLVVSPEYNGSFPGVLKLLIDAVSVNDYKKTFSGKKVSLIGVASGRAGNFRGMEHLTGIFNYLNMLVMPNKLPISSVENVVNPEGALDRETISVLTSFIDELKQFSALDLHQV